ncbi:MAG: type II toxin-antitoxin system PrlF family antitoxin [Deltaproteobacteria bacterium]|nr:type II toxin-antitoxin system PrlF family antitoxin [Deltaproteobacteria bacterium]MDH4122066.1 type II toxin-antitoxin system PrlF family antitoxin [Deltaproteobacteria bacterium]
MQITTSKITKHFQATIPEPVRKALNLHAGEAIAFDIEGGEIRLRKAEAMDMEWPQALEPTLSEWAGEADEEAYRDL